LGKGEWVGAENDNGKDSLCGDKLVSKTTKAKRGKQSKPSTAAITTRNKAVSVAVVMLGDAGNRFGNGESRKIDDVLNIDFSVL
jgi:hypothetical protein